MGYTLNEELPHFSTVSYNFRHRFTEQTAEQVFSRILEEAGRAGYLEPEAVFVDGTHIKANANINKKIKKAVPEAAKRYVDQVLSDSWVAGAETNSSLCQERARADLLISIDGSAYMVVLPQYIFLPLSLNNRSPVLSC